MTVYETVFLARQELSTPQVKELTDHISKIITDNGGKILKTEDWGLKTLAYKINKAKKAHYVLIESEAEGPAIHEAERQMRIHDDVMRYLTIKLKEPTTEPSPMARGAEDQKEAA
jgi:small subunit ribosomal protein S6